MPQKPNSFSNSEMISSVEESLREFWGNWGRAPQSELYDSPGMMRLYTGVPYAFCNGVICSQLSPQNVDTVINEAVAYFRARNATWEWIIGPNLLPSSFDKSLEKHGLFCVGHSIGMAIDLHTMSQDIPLIADFKIIPVEDEETLSLWANSMVTGFSSPALYPNFVKLEQSLGCQTIYRRYLGLLNDQPVSTSAMFLGEKVAGIYCVSTLPKSRRLGIGAAITLYALRDARAMGYHAAVLQSSEMGRTVYGRIGFKEVSALNAFRPKT